MNDTKDLTPAGEFAEDLAEPDAGDAVAAQNEVKPTKQQSVARSAGIVSIAVMFSRVLGLVREMIFARYLASVSFSTPIRSRSASRTSSAISSRKAPSRPRSLRFLRITRSTKAKRKRGNWRASY